MTDTITPAEVFPPWEYLRDELEARGWTVSEFAQILGRPLQAISEILNGKKEITPETAVEIAAALGTSAEVWLNLQSAYQLGQVAAERKISVVSRRGLLRSIAPVSEMRRRGWITDTDDVDTLERDVLDLYETDSVGEAPTWAYAARGSSEPGVLDPPQMAWLAFVRHQATTVDLAQFDRAALEAYASEIPRRLRDGSTALASVFDDLRHYGVAVVAEPGLRGRKLDGAVVFTSTGHPAIGLTTRYDRFDGLVFTLLHEISHITLRHVTASTTPLIDDDLRESDDESDSERAANTQASDWIFPGGFEPPPGSITAASIARTAAAHGVHPSMVIGRLQRDKVIPWSSFRQHVLKVRAHLGIDSKRT